VNVEVPATSKFIVQQSAIPLWHIGCEYCVLHRFGFRHWPGGSQTNHFESPLVHTSLFFIWVVWAVQQKVLLLAVKVGGLIVHLFNLKKSVKMENRNKKKIITSIILGQSLNSVRLLAVLFVVSSSVLRFIYDKYLPGFIDPPEIRWGLNAIVGLFFISTYLMQYRSPVHLAYMALTLYLLVLSYTVFLTLANEFHPFSVTLLILVIGGGTVIINSTTFYMVQSAIILLITIYQFVNKEFNEAMVIALFNIFITIGVFGTALFVRLRLAEEVRFSNSLMEKIQLFSIIAKPSGEIDFVSPSVKTLLGYEAKGLLKEGWWRNQNLSHCWIEKEHILNYPGIIPAEIKSIESSVTTGDGRLVWLSWTNSILPNGNYIGVASDISKYKIGATQTAERSA
jgi:PAS domain S-box-containing protein